MPSELPTLEETLLWALQLVVAYAMVKFGLVRVSARVSRRIRRRARRSTKNGKP